MDGFINLLKPTGMTSHDAVSVIRKMMGQKKVGHTGTLDPMAIGVLPVGLGCATKITEYLEQDKKSYRCEMILGIRSDTGDIWGDLTGTEKQEQTDPQAVLQAAESLVGQISQIPPLYSAVRVDGRRLYEYARSGAQITPKPRQVTIHCLKILRVQKGRILFDLTCSKGTYVRSVCTQIGELLGCGGVMSFLARTGSGAFHINEALTLEEIKKALEEGRDPASLLLPVDYPIGDYGRIDLNQAKAKRFVNGNWLKSDRLSIQEGNLKPYYRVYEGDLFLGMGLLDQEKAQLRVHKVFFRQL